MRHLRAPRYGAQGRLRAPRYGAQDRFRVWRVVTQAGRPSVRIAAQVRG